jgi:hypothetical protein
MTIAYIVVWSLHLSGSMGSESRWAAGRSSTPVAMPDELTQLPMKPLRMYICVCVYVCVIYMCVCYIYYMFVYLSVCLSIYLILSYLIYLHNLIYLSLSI